MITREQKGPFVSELADKQSIESVFLVREKHFGTGKNGKNFLSMQLGDRSGAIDSRIWENGDVVPRACHPYFGWILYHAPTV